MSKLFTALQQRAAENPGPMTPEQARALHVENTAELFPAGTPVIRTAGANLRVLEYSEGLFSVLDPEEDYIGTED